jgi:protein-S-isoprenylcysteine O-methyltransferase Ste14
MMPVYAYLTIVAGIVIWFYPFVPAHQKTGPASVVNRRSRWGMLLQFLAFTLLWQGRFWTRSLPSWRELISVVLFALASLLSWSSSRALAGQLRADAALGADHHLVRSGPYRLVRNPIYLSMLLVICAITVVVTPWPLFLAAVVVFVVGTEIRVRTEEKLLASHFGEEFTNYKRSTPAYIPFLKIAVRP